MARTIYHLCRRKDWQAAEAAGAYAGAVEDRADGFLHFSTAGQIVESARRHRAGEPDLMLLTVDAADLGPALRWEASRDGALFPHLYADLPLAAVRRATALPLDAAGRHVFPALED